MFNLSKFDTAQFDVDKFSDTVYISECVAYEPDSTIRSSIIDFNPSYITGTDYSMYFGLADNADGNNISWEEIILNQEYVFNSPNKGLYYAILGGSGVEFDLTTDNFKIIYTQQ